MTDLLFAFDQDEMNALIESSSDSDDIVLSLFSAKDPTDNKKRLFLAATNPSNVTSAGTATKIPVGCPVPPGWNTVVPPVTLMQLINTPSFVLSAASKKELKDNKSGDQLVAGLEGFTKSNVLESKLSFKIKDAAGKTVKDIDATLD
ncbi:MAG: hypothetical protein ABIN67_22535 [Ferruginibacter sp.]